MAASDRLGPAFAFAGALLRRGLDRARELPARAAILARVGRESGVVFALRPSGIRALVGLIGASRNPSQIFRVHAANTPDKTAVLWRDRSLTFGQLYERMNRAAAGLQRRGIERGASVVLMMRNRPEFLEVQAATAIIGASAVSVSWRSTPRELAYVAAHSGAKAIVLEADLAPVVEEAAAQAPALARAERVAVGGDAPGCARYEDDFLAPPSVAPRVRAGDDEDAAVVVYTSGTTGAPKGAVRRFPKDAMYAFLGFVAEAGMRADDVHLVTCPLYHSTAFGFLSMSGLLGATVALMDEFKPEAFLEHVDRLRATTTAVVPTMLHRILSLGPDVIARYDTRSLRAIYAAGAPLPAPLATATMDAFGDVLFNVYGSTETGLVTLARPADLRAAPGTIGRAVPGNEIRLLDEDGRDVAAGQIGELYARSTMLVAGYHRDEASTRASMRDGFFSVGDLARRDGDGRYFIEGRKRDMIISGGVNVYPAEVEAVLEAHPDVAEVAVVGADDPEWGERVRAFVVCRPGATVDDAALKAWCRERLAGPKVPRELTFLEALPRNATGKVLKRELRGGAGG